MDSFELNKIIGAVLGTLLFVMGVGFLAEALYSPIASGPGYPLPEPETVAVAETGAAEAEVPLGVLLASASAENGAAAVRKCQSCHTFEQGGPNKQGPNLFGIVGRLIGSHPDFAYSEPFLALNAEGRNWTYEELDPFIANPKAHIPGTKMNFAGVRTGEERADILAYLQTLAAEPVPFPAADEAGPASAPSGDEVVEPAEGTQPQPVDVIETPTETTGDTPVVGTPTGSGTGVEPEQQQSLPAADAPTIQDPPSAVQANPGAEAPANPAAPADSTPEDGGGAGGDGQNPANNEAQAPGQTLIAPVVTPAP